MHPRWRHHGHGRGPPPWWWEQWRPSPFSMFIKARLHRRLFMWFLTSMIATIALTIGIGAVIWHYGNAKGPMQRPGVEKLMGSQFEKVWDDAPGRAGLANEIANDIGFDITLFDMRGQRLYATAEPCERPWYDAPVLRGGTQLGHVTMCARSHAMEWWKIAVPIAIALFFITATTGRIARRLSRPLAHVADVVKKIGNGDLSARATVRMKDEIGIVAEAVNEMAARIEKQMKDQRELLAAVSHELRTPLARIRLLTEMGRDGAASASTFDEVDREVVEIDALVGELLANSRIDFGAMAARELDVADVAGRAVQRAGLSAEKLEIAADAAKVTADATLLLRALSNLIDNAKKHGGGLDKLLIERRNGSIVFEALDRGPGIPAGDEERVFQPFHKKANGQPRAEGSLGLGLALVQRIATAHGGKAWAKNRDGGGAVVGLELPATPVNA